MSLPKTWKNLLLWNQPTTPAMVWDIILTDRYIRRLECPKLQQWSPLRWPNRHTLTLNCLTLRQYDLIPTTANKISLPVLIDIEAKSSEFGQEFNLISIQISKLRNSLSIWDDYDFDKWANAFLCIKSTNISIKSKIVSIYDF